MKAIAKETWDNATEYTDFERLPAGGYVCAIMEVEDVEEKEYLFITFDIAEGEYADYYSDEWGQNNKWAHRFTRSYKESAIGMMKGFLKAVDESNNTKFSESITSGLDERKLVGRLVGLILREEEYESNRGDIRTKLSVHRAVPISVIRSGDYKVPETKRLSGSSNPQSGSAAPGFTQMSNDDMPF